MDIIHRCSSLIISLVCQKRILAIQSPFLAKQINRTKYNNRLREMCGEIYMEKNQLAFYEAVQQLDITRRALNEACEAYHISFEQFVLMKRIAVAGGIRPTQLSEDLHISRAAVSRKLTQLYYSDYLAKERSGINEDQRVVIISLTPTGEIVVKKLDHFYQAKLARLKNPIEEVQATAKILEVLSQGI